MLLDRRTCKIRQVMRTRKNKATGNVAKQLARVGRNMQTLNSRFTKIAGSKVRKAGRRLKRGIPGRSAYGITATNIPMEVAYSVRQPNNVRTHTETACEYIGDFVIRPNSVNGEGVRFPMNPLLLFRTRLFNLARNYQKYRFTRLALKIQSSSTTSTNGLYVAGYCSNPDFEYENRNAVAALFSLPGAQSTNVWRTIVIDAKLEDRGKWYNLDEDSNEIMQTTQGFFGIAVQSPTSATAPIIMPILLEYSIQFAGTAFNDVSNGSRVVVFPSGSWGYNSVTGNYTFTADSGEPPVPSTSNGTGYVVIPGYPATFNSVETVIGVVKPTTASWSFYTTVDAYGTNDAIQANETFRTDRSTWTPILN